MTRSATCTISGSFSGSLQNILENGTVPDTVRLPFGISIPAIALANGVAENQINCMWNLSKYHLDPDDYIDLDFTAIDPDIGLGNGIDGVGSPAFFDIGIVAIILQVYPGGRILLDPGGINPYTHLKGHISGSSTKNGVLLWVSPGFNDENIEASLADRSTIRLTAGEAGGYPDGTDFDFCVVGRANV